MLYKVTPALAPPPRRPRAADGSRPKKRRASAVFDSDGHEVLITLMCLKCRQVRPLAQFGLRKMPDGAIRNQPWCRGCRGAATPKKRPESVEPTTPPAASADPPAAATEPEPGHLVSLPAVEG
ncbi:MAG TPA: hypothetical protein VLT82_23125 [Myxococcaceae bacterium]|nr:hypothetical protein [Myxococcaceae bacterium]